MRVGDMALIQKFNVNTVKNTINNNIAKTSNQNSAVATIKQDTYTPANRIMSYEDFHQLMTSDKSAQEKHAALVEVYGDVLSFCAYEGGMKAVQSGSFSLEEYHSEMERRSALSKVSMAEMIAAFEAADPNKAEMERDTALAKKFVPIQNKMFAGKQLTGEEKSFLQEHYPEFYAKAIQIEQEVEQLKARLKSAKSEEEAARIYMETKVSLMSGGKKDPGVLLMIPAIDEAYRSSMNKL